MPNKPATFHAKHLRSVFAPVETRSFSAGNFDACTGFLEERSATTAIEPVSAIEQLLLRSDGAVAETGYRFNPIGFTAIAAAIAPGLSSVFNELAGEVRYRHAIGAAPSNVAAAVSIFNTALAANFDQLRERNLLVNNATKTIEGFLGLDHKFLDNSVFVDMVARELFEAQGPSAKFYLAELVGRELRLYYAAETTRWVYSYANKEYVFSGGWYFSNREDTGAAIHATTCLLTKFGLGLAADNKRNHVRHAGADIVGRAVMLVNRVSETSPPSREKFDAVFNKFSSMPLILNAAQSLDDAVNFWAEKLLRYKVSKDDAKKICKNALLVGADLAPQDALAAYDRDTLKKRTVFDLMCAIFRYARGQYHTTRDTLQRAAMSILDDYTKRISL